jgi:hypothetical protein
MASSVRPAESPSIDPPGADYRLGYIELDEQGWLWGQKGQQILQVQHLIDQESGLVDPAKGVRGVILVAFVHGWKNNAAVGNPNVESFKTTLAALAKTEKEHNKEHPRPVIGVYIGWPGLRADVEPLRELSFYSRKNVGDRVGYLGGVTEVLCRLEKIHDAINAAREKESPDSPRSFFLVVGHSFGAQVVYDSLSSVLTSRVVASAVGVNPKFYRAAPADANASSSSFVHQKPADDQPVRPFGDLILLLNPAFEADRYHNLLKLSQQFDYPAEQRPVFAVFQSETDWATRYVFPFGRTFGALLEHYRDDDLQETQYRANHHTIPWTDELVTHELLTEEEAAGEKPAVAAKATRSHALADQGTDSPEHWRRVLRDWGPATRADELRLSHCVLIPVKADSDGKLVPIKPNPKEWTPFYVVRVRPSLMDGHSDIWENPRFHDFLAKFVAISLPTKS